MDRTLSILVRHRQPLSCSALLHSHGSGRYVPRMGVNCHQMRFCLCSGKTSVHDAALQPPSVGRRLPTASHVQPPSTYVIRLATKYRRVESGKGGRCLGVPRSGVVLSFFGVPLHADMRMRTRKEGRFACTVPETQNDSLPAVHRSLFLELEESRNPTNEPPSDTSRLQQ